MGSLPNVALSIRQPWAWLIVNGHKDVENRTWRTNFRGPVLIHAGKAVDRAAHEDWYWGAHPATGEYGGDWVDKVRPPEGGFDLGGIVGVAEVVDCVSSSGSPWFCGPFGFVLRNARPLPFTPLKGALGFFKVPEGAVR